MTKEELLRKIKKINIRTKAVADEFFVGNYHSIFKGNGMEFSDVRPYEIGDDVKRIDWKITARQKRTYIKQYEEEREGKSVDGRGTDMRKIKKWIHSLRGRIIILSLKETEWNFLM